MLAFLYLLTMGLPLALAQYGGGGKANSSPSPSPTVSADPNVHTVLVGQGGLQFTPNMLTASPGQKVQFQFFPPNHTVTQSSFENPCQPLNATSFFSGFMATSASPGPQTFTIDIVNNDPIWFYCSQSSPLDHCASGMAGVINPPSDGSQTIDQYVNAAKSVTSSGTQPTVQGGVVALRSGTGTSSGATAGATPTGANGAGTVVATGGFVSILAGLLAVMMM